MNKQAGIFGGISVPGPSGRGRAIADVVKNFASKSVSKPPVIRTGISKMLETMSPGEVIDKMKKPGLRLLQGAGEGLKKAAGVSIIGPHFKAGFEDARLF